MTLAMEEMYKKLPQNTSSWLKGQLTLYKNQGFWNMQDLHEGAILAQKRYKAQPTDVLLCSCPKTGTTWLKALAFAVVTRDKFDESTSPLLTTLPHDCIPLLEKDYDRIKENNKSSDMQVIATHLPYHALPNSVVSSNCKIVYIYRNIKDVIVSHYHMFRISLKFSEEDAPFEEAFDEFYQGISWCGPYWDHVLGYWKASLELQDRILFLKYEDMKRDATNNVKKLAEFIGYPFSIEEEKTGVVESIIKLCSFENLSNLEVNKSGKHRADEPGAVENRIYFRKAEDGDWKNNFTNEMKEKIEKLVEEKLAGTNLVLK